MKVQANFTPRYHAATLSYQRPDSLLRSVVKQPRIVGMYSHSRVNVLMFFTQLNRAFQRTAFWVAGAHVQDRGHSRITSALDDLCAIRVKLRTVNVCVGIDKHGYRQVSQRQGV
jgi:hypothetical protein